MAPLIEFKNLFLKTKDGKELFNDINLKVYPKDKLLINGDSGCGKTTFLKILPGGVKADQGEVLFEGEQITPSFISRVRDKIFYISQHPVVGALKPIDIIKLPFTFRNRKNKTKSKKGIY